MNDEYTTLQRNKTWELVPFSSEMNLIDCKWVFQVKYNLDGSILKHKARLVAKSFLQNPGIDFAETFSPAIKAPTIRILFFLAVSFGWDIQQGDVNNAFLNGDLNEAIFMTQPEGFVDPDFPTHVYRLKKSLYGLKQALRAWYTKLKSVLQDWGFKRAVFDTSLFIKRNSKYVLFCLGVCG